MPRIGVMIMRWAVPPLVLVLLLFTAYATAESRSMLEADGRIERDIWSELYWMFVRPAVFEVGLVLAPYVSYRSMRVRIISAVLMIGSLFAFSLSLHMDFLFILSFYEMRIPIELFSFNILRISLFRALLYLLAFWCLFPKKQTPKPAL